MEVIDMPGRDGTGSLGLRGRGNMQRPFGRGFFCRGGHGRGCRRMFYETDLLGWARLGDNNTQDATALRTMEKILEEQLESVRQEINGLGGKE